jgi:O-antigen ligase
MNIGVNKLRLENFVGLFHALAFSSILIIVVISPWCFGAWEMWWFWPMAALIFAAAFFSGLASLAGTLFSSVPADVVSTKGHFQMTGGIAAILISSLPFMAYALIRAQFPSGVDRALVDMEAERSLLLFFTPALLATVMFLSFTRLRLRMLISAFAGNLVVIAIYACVSHILTNGMDNPDYVLWVVTPWGYGDRAKGPFFCPNHLSALLNLGICLLAALLATPKLKSSTRMWSLVAMVALVVPNFLTLSRGGIGSLLLGMLIGLSTVALRGHRLWIRRMGPVVIMISVVGAGLAIRFTDNPLMRRISEHPLYRTAVQDFGKPEWREKIHDVFWYQFDRGTYIQSALRAWRSNPVWGIGPGQHSNRWAEFSATDPGVRPVGGDPRTMKKPRYYNDQQHLYEVHSDWTQLLEEYGVVGLSLFLVPMVAFFTVCFRAQSAVLGIRSAGEHREVSEVCQISDLERALPLASLLAGLILFIHSFGDFSLQMPSIVWSFAALLTGGVLAATPSIGRGEE